MPKALPASVILKASLCPWSQSFLNLHGGPSLLHGQRGRIAFTVPRVPVRADPVTPEGFCLLQTECQGWITCFNLGSLSREPRLQSWFC